MTFAIETTRPARPVPKLNSCCGPDLLHYFREAWALEDKLLNSLVGAETFYLQPDPLRNPLIFYLGHSAVFYVNKLVRVGLLSERINADYEVLFEIGVDPDTPDELNAVIQGLHWPEVAAVWDYRDRVKAAIERVIQTMTFELPIDQQHPCWALLMAIEHQRIHVETSSMLVRQLPIEHLQCPPDWSIAPQNQPTPPNRMQVIPGGTVVLGKATDDPTYGWDSEYGRRVVEVPAFAASQFLITNREYLAFVEAAGYDQETYWSPAGWQWQQTHGVRHPKFWIPESSGGYRYRSTFVELDLPLDWPVEVNYYEAIAFCHWKGDGFRLMSEAEWNRALQVSDPNYFPINSSLDGPSEPETQHNLSWKWVSPSPVGQYQNQTPNHQDFQDSQPGLADLRGNVWEWIADAFNPLPGFEPHPLYEDQSAPFFDDDHRMMLGGSWATNGSMALPSYRNWFRPHFYQHAGFRIAQGIDVLCH